ncbi:hypothetical protein HYC85_027038 [Camellia sinensis]|uniref:Uncharacterized protein n=1 Tax=Camellia sinensis TaxID=4442 RepID=A0A7J7G5C6_CAMSI|nr:hypothetical protein HYC85_027038 [Camellia sinensis]
MSDHLRASNGELPGAGARQPSCSIHGRAVLHTQALHWLSPRRTGLGGISAKPSPGHLLWSAFLPIKRLPRLTTPFRAPVTQLDWLYHRLIKQLGPTEHCLAEQLLYGLERHILGPTPGSPSMGGSPIMHGRGQNDSSKEGEKGMCNTGESLSTLVVGSHNAARHAQAGDNNNVAANTTTELGETNDLPQNKTNHVVDSFTQEPNVDLSYGQHTQDTLQHYSNTQGAGDYTQLLNQYYELEEQRQKILQQLQQFGSWHYQGSGSNVQWGTSSASLEHPVPTSQASYPAVVSSYCPYGCQCLVAPCSLGGTCAGKTCDATSGIDHNGKLTSSENGDIIKTALGAAESALSSLKIKTSGILQSSLLQRNGIARHSTALSNGGNEEFDTYNEEVVTSVHMHNEEFNAPISFLLQHMEIGTIECVMAIAQTNLDLLLFINGR